MRALSGADELIAKSERMAGEASPEDAEEIRQLAVKIRSADANTSLEEIEKAIAALEDLVFYLQDAE